VTSSIRPIRIPARARARRAACPPGPGCLVPVPPVALSLTWRAVIPTSLHLAAQSWAANMAAYGEDSSRSALTFIPPVTREMVSLPERSVTWTKVSLKLMVSGGSSGGFVPFRSTVPPRNVWRVTYCVRALRHARHCYAPRRSAPMLSIAASALPSANLRSQKPQLTKRKCEQRRRRSHPQRPGVRGKQPAPGGLELSWYRPKRQLLPLGSRDSSPF